MSGQATTWIIADRFKQTITAAKLERLRNHPAASSDIVFIELRRQASPQKTFRKLTDMARALEQAGIALRRPVGIGVTPGGQALLALAHPADATDLQAYIERQGARPAYIALPEGKDLVDLFLDFSAGLRQVAVLPADFSLSDVLLATEGAMPKLYLADPGRLGQKRSRTGRKKIDSPVMVNAMLWGRAPSRLQLAALQLCWAKAARWVRQAVLRLGDLLSELRIFCCGQQENFLFFKRGSLRGSLRRDIQERVAGLLEDPPDALCTSSGAEIVKNSPTTTAVLAMAPGLPWPLYVKRYNKKGRLFGLKYALRRSRAQRVWELACRLQEAGDLVPEVLGFAERRRAGMLEAAYLFTRGIEGARSLDAYAQACFPGWTGAQKKQLLEKAALLVRFAHGRGLLHGDLKAKNIIIGADGQCRLIDLDASRLRGTAGLAERCRDLARLNSSFLDTRLVSRTHRLRFLKIYLNEAGLIRPAWEHITEMTDTKLKKSGRAFTAVSRGSDYPPEYLDDGPQPGAESRS